MTDIAEGGNGIIMGNVDEWRWADSYMVPTATVSNYILSAYVEYLNANYWWNAAQSSQVVQSSSLLPFFKELPVQPMGNKQIEAIPRYWASLLSRYGLSQIHNAWRRTLAKRTKLTADLKQHWWWVEPHPEVVLVDSTWNQSYIISHTSRTECWKTNLIMVLFPKSCKDFQVNQPWANMKMKAPWREKALRSIELARGMETEWW